MTKNEIADFGGGCFWGVEEAFRITPGVVKTTAGYEGGNVDSPSYEQVRGHNTGHAETVQVEFNPTKTSYNKLLDVFFENYDPTQVARQGADAKDNYRTVIFYHSSEQQQMAQDKIKELEKSASFSQPIATQVVPAKTFWKAEEYHQQYLKKRSLASRD